MKKDQEREPSGSLFLFWLQVYRCKHKEAFDRNLTNIERIVHLSYNFIKKVYNYWLERSKEYSVDVF